MNKIKSHWAFLFLCIVVTALCSDATGQENASHTAFSGTEVHVAWLAQPAPELTPSGHLKIEGWEHLWYDDADDDRLDGYATVFIDAMIDPMGAPIHLGGKFTLHEKRDSLDPAVFQTGAFDLADVTFGDLLFEGSWRLGPDGITGITVNKEGLRAHYNIAPTANPNLNLFSGILLDANIPAQSVPEPSAELLMLFGLLPIFIWRKNRVT